VKGFPTALHEEVAWLSHDFLVGCSFVDTVLVVNSCARGRAVPESDLDLAALTNAATDARELGTLETGWREYLSAQPSVQRFSRAGQFAKVHVDVFNGLFTPQVWDDGGGPDDFELEIGNRIVYGAPLGKPGNYYHELQRRWLPYYDNDLRTKRLSMVREACFYDLDRVLFLARRELYFAAFDWLYKAYREFIQALFIARRTYPISYTKWIREQLLDRMALPEVYDELPRILEMTRLEGADVSHNADRLRRLVDGWASE
jgi:hypothetical protein